MSHRYNAHGLTVLSEIELPLPPEAGLPAGIGLSLRRGPDRVVTGDDPPGELLARLAAPGGRVFYALTAEADRTVLRYPELCEFVGDAGLQVVTVHLHPGRDPGVLSVLASGALLAVHLRLAGELVLHASAVRIGDVAVAFVGGSGMGKSTMATLQCADGHALLTDDVLRTEVGPSGAVVHAGSTEIRLRDAARPLAIRVVGDVRETADGRLAVRTGTHRGAPVPLAACVVPQPRRDRRTTEVRRLGGAEALMLLSRFPRLVGWTGKAAVAREFQQLADLVDSVPVYEAAMPWGPPFPAGVAAEVIVALGLGPGQR